jgi:hypothetical protein
MIGWADVLAAYTLYLATLAWGVRRFARARVPATVSAGLSVALWRWWPAAPGDASDPGALAIAIVVPSLALLAAYRVSGAMFVAPMPALERRLLAIDEQTLVRPGVLARYRAAHGAVREFFELMYVLVYAVVPLGATVLALGNRAGALDRYWLAVFGAELACFAMLPWAQTRPPRALEADSAPPAGPPLMRRLNLVILRHGSIQVNTVPSGHAAGSFAVALAVASALPAAGGVFLALAIVITVATVLGRYHYLADSVLGVIVALAVWVAAGR